MLYSFDESARALEGSYYLRVAHLPGLVDGMLSKRQQAAQPAGKLGRIRATPPNEPGKLRLDERMAPLAARVGHSYTRAKQGDDRCLKTGIVAAVRSTVEPAIDYFARCGRYALSCLRKPSLQLMDTFPIVEVSATGVAVNILKLKFGATDDPQPAVPAGPFA
jgi:hypothetical protein